MTIDKVSKKGVLTMTERLAFDHTFHNTAGLNAMTLGRSVCLPRDECKFSAGIWFDLRTRFRK